MTFNDRPLDETDMRLVEMLHANSRATFKELGEAVHLTGQAVRNRVERLEDLGIVQRYTVNVNCPVFGYRVHALLRGRFGKRDLARLSTLSARGRCRVVHCYTCTGERNTVVDVHFRDMETMTVFVRETGEEVDLDAQVVLDERCDFGK